MKSYWLRCASSAITTMLRRSDSTGWRSPFSSGKNFWIVVNTTPPEATEQLGAQVGAVGRLHRRLAQQLVAARERAEQLVVQVVAVGEHDDGRVLHRRAQDHPAGIERHRQALAGALRVPDHADAPVALLAAGRRPGVVAARSSAKPCACASSARIAPQRLLQRDVDGVELVVARHLLDELAAARVLEHDEVPDQIEEAALLEHAFQQHLQLGAGSAASVLALDGAPRHEPFPAGAERADARLRAVGDDQRGVGREQRRDLRL